MQSVLMSLVLVSAVSLGFAAAASAENAKPAKAPVLGYPVCDRAHTDSCLELGQNAELDRKLRQAYPNCARLAGKERQAACINSERGTG